LEFKLLLAVGFLCAYLLGSIPFGYLVAKSRGIDILNFGSKSIGATNVFRALGPKLGVPVLLLDVLKGVLPAVAGTLIFHSQIDSFLMGMAAVAGHCLSPFLKFKGGKGIATGLGAMLGSVPQVALAALAVFTVVMVVSRYVSLSSIVAALTIVPFGLYFHVAEPLLWSFGALALFIIYKHGANSRRLIGGTEPKFTLSPKPKPKPQTPPGWPAALVIVVHMLAAGTSTYFLHK